MKKRQRIKVFKNDENLGLTKSLNNLIAVAKGKIIARQDGDDISLKAKILKQVIFSIFKIRILFYKSKSITRRKDYAKI